MRCSAQDPGIPRVACETRDDDRARGLGLWRGDDEGDRSKFAAHRAPASFHDIGYTSSDMGFDAATCAVTIALGRQSTDISQGVSEGEGLHKEQGAGDQGMMFGFACDETAPDFMAAHVAKRDRYELIFRHMFEEGIASGEFIDQDVGLAVKAILGMCNSAVRWYRPGRGHTPEEIAAEFAHFAVGGATASRSVPLLEEAAP